MTKKDVYNEACEAFPFLKNLSKDEKELFYENMSYGKNDKGKILMGEGYSCNSIVFILEGAVRIYKISELGREITLYRIGSGETCILSIFCVMGNSDYQAIAEVEEESKMIYLPTEVFKKLFEKSNVFQRFVFNCLSNRLSEVMMIVEEIAFQSMDKRIAKFIYDSCNNSKNDSIKITHEQIALELGTAREVVSRMLKEFEKRGYVSLSRGTINVNKKESLKILGEM